jgi:hypothetical protein
VPLVLRQDGHAAGQERSETHEEIPSHLHRHASGSRESEGNELDEEKRKALQAAGVQAWMEWGRANSAAIVDQGSPPLGRTKRSSPLGITDTKNAMTGYVIVQAESHEAAARLFENHPHFTIFPGDSVEIMECLPLPAQ